MARPKRICSVDGCGKPHRGLGYCDDHYFRFKKHGDPMGGKTPKGISRQFFEAAVLHNSADKCLTWPLSRSADGRAVMYFGEGQSMFVARHICIRVYGQPPTPKHVAAHSCGKGHEGCVNPHHLRWATHTENMADMLGHGTRPRGIIHYMSKLTDDAVRQIRASTEEQSILARRYGVSQPLISNIRSGAGWKHVTP